MTKKPKPKPIKALNPRYAGATPDMVARALLRQKRKGAKVEGAIAARRAARSGI